MKVLLSAPRCGSSWVYDGIAAENQKLDNVELEWPSELFNDQNPKHGSHIFEKLQWLYDKRGAGFEISFKHHINYLIRPEVDLYKQWFWEFYKDHEVIVLKRRNLEDWFKSFLVQESVSWKTASISKPKVVGSLDEMSYKPIQTVDQSIQQFVDIKRMLDRVEHENTIYYEDLSGDWKSHSVRHSAVLDYDMFLSQHLDMNEVWEKFEKCLNASE